MKKIIAALIAASTLSGCFSLTYNAPYAPDDSVSMTKEKDAKIYRHFRAESKGVWLGGGLIPISTPNFGETVQREAGGRPVQSVSIHSEESFIDGALYLAGFLVVNLVLAQTMNPTGNSNTAIGVVSLATMLAPRFRSVVVEGDVIDRPATVQ